MAPPTAIKKHPVSKETALSICTTMKLMAINEISRNYLVHVYHPQMKLR